MPSLTVYLQKIRNTLNNNIALLKALVDMFIEMSLTQPTHPVNPSRTGTTDGPVGSSSLDTTSASSSEAEATMKAGKQIAGALLETLEKKLGASVVIGIYAEIQRRLQATRAEKKRVLASEAVSNPRAHAQRKAEKALRKKESRKRKASKGTCFL